MQKLCRLSFSRVGIKPTNVTFTVRRFAAVSRRRPYSLNLKLVFFNTNRFLKINIHYVGCKMYICAHK